jgi:hypothetical protein
LIALAASQAAGCIIESGDDDGGGDFALVSATWSIRDAVTDADVGCPADYDTAALYNQPVDANGNNAGAVVVDLFNCTDKAGTSAPLDPGLYLTWIEIANHDNTAVYAKSLSAFVDVTVSDKTFNAQILDNGGYFQLAWDLVGAQTNAPLTCASAGATNGVEAIGTDVSDANNSNSDIFDCEDGSGITAGYAAGTYTVSVAALGAGDASVGTADAITNAVIDDRNQVTNLGTIEIPIDGL